MKICLLCYRGNPYSGGQGIYLKYIAEELVKQGHEVHAIVGPPYPEYMEGVVLHKIENNQYYGKEGSDIINKKSPMDILSPINFYEYLHTRMGAFSEISSFTYRAYILLRKLQKKYNYDIIHDNQSIGYGLLLMKSFGIPVVATIHHPLSIDLINVLERVSTFKKKIKSIIFYPILMQKFVSKRLDHIITVSKDSKKMIHKDFGVELKNQTVIYNGIDRSIFRKLSCKKKKNQIIFVGNIEDGKKGFVYLLKAMILLKKDIKLLVIDGGAPHRKITLKLIDKLGIKDKIIFAGRATTDELVKYYSESVIAIVPSVYEGFGFPAGEAMACGTPVISSDGGALPEVVGDAGIIVKLRDERMLAEAIDSLIDDEDKLKLLSIQGIKRVEEYFSWELEVKKMVKLYKSLI
jgi:MMP alpha-(1->4)-mannosyltransferase